MTQPVQEYSHATTQVSTKVEIYTNRFKQLEWILAETFNVLAITLVSWLAFSLIVYGKQTGKWRKENRLNPTKVDAGIVYTLAVFATICCFLRLATNQAVFNFGYTDRSSLPCEVGTAISFVWYTLFIIGVYMFLWFRQHSLYRHPSMEEVKKRWLERLGFMNLILIFVGAFFILACLLVTFRYIPTGKGCFKTARFGQLPKWPYYLIISFQEFNQAALLFQFLYPLFLNLSGRNTDRVIKIMKRSAISAGICSLSDVVSMLIVVFVVSDKHMSSTAITAYDINMIVNTASVFFSFESWRKTFMAPIVSCSSSQASVHTPQNSACTTSVEIHNIKS